MRGHPVATGTAESVDVLVIGGGGVLGAATAYYLARKGTDVLRVERGALNREASGANAGTLHIQYLEHPVARL
jgi:glycine/D-amino acid oxidase-like deaminating enzyme